MEEGLAVGDQTYDSPDVTKIDETRTQWTNLKPTESIRLSFPKGVRPDVVKLTPSEDDNADFAKLRFKVQTQGLSQEEPEDFNSGKVRSIIIIFCLTYEKSNSKCFKTWVFENKILTCVLYGFHFLIYFQEIQPLRKQNSDAFMIDLTTPSPEPINLLILTVARRVGGSTDDSDDSNAISVEVEIKQCVEGMNAFFCSYHIGSISKLFFHNQSTTYHFF